MSDSVVRIDQLRLRVPGLSEPKARRLGEEVARRVARALPLHGRAEHLGVLELRVSVPAGATEERLAERIAEEILKKLR